MFLGVCGGIAEWLDLDPVLVRVAFVLFTFAGGFGVLLYIVLAFIVPEERDSDYVAAPGLTDAERAARQAERDARRAEREARRANADRRGPMVFGVILIIVGAWFLIRHYVPSFPIDDLWPVLLVILGGVLLVGSLARGSDS